MPIRKGQEQRNMDHKLRDSIIKDRDRWCKKMFKLIKKYIIYKWPKKSP